MWRLVSHLTLNHLSISGAEEGAKALREIVSLYDVRGSDQTRGTIEVQEWAPGQPRHGRGLHGARDRKLVRWTREGTRGMEYNAWGREGGNPPEHHTILYFTRLVATVRGREGVLRRWQPRAGDRPLV